MWAPAMRAPGTQNSHSLPLTPTVPSGDADGERPLVRKRFLPRRHSLQLSASVSLLRPQARPLTHEKVGAELRPGNSQPGQPGTEARLGAGWCGGLARCGKPGRDPSGQLGLFAPLRKVWLVAAAAPQRV